MPDEPDAAPITKADLRAAIGAAVEHLETRIGARIERLETRMEARIDASVEHMKARIERTETTLLTEFHKWASPTEMRLRSHSAALRALDIQQEAAGDALRSIVDRIAALERKAEGRQPPSPTQ